MRTTDDLEWAPMDDQPITDDGRAELDYAFLAEAAERTPDGRITATGISPSALNPASDGSVSVAVVGRIHLGKRPSAELEIELTHDQTTMSYHQSVDAGPRASAARSDDGDDRQHLVFALQTQIHVDGANHLLVRIALDGQEVRQLSLHLGEATDG